MPASLTLPHTAALAVTHGLLSKACSREKRACLQPARGYRAAPSLGQLIRVQKHLPAGPTPPEPPRASSYRRVPTTPTERPSAPAVGALPLRPEAQPRSGCRAAPFPCQSCASARTRVAVRRGFSPSGPEPEVSRAAGRREVAGREGRPPAGQVRAEGRSRRRRRVAKGGREAGQERESGAELPQMPGIIPLPFRAGSGLPRLRGLAAASSIPERRPGRHGIVPPEVPFFPQISHPEIAPVQKKG